MEKPDNNESDNKYSQFGVTQEDLALIEQQKPPSERDITKSPLYPYWITDLVINELSRTLVSKAEPSVEADSTKYMRRIPDGFYDICYKKDAPDCYQRMQRFKESLYEGELVKEVKKVGSVKNLEMIRDAVCYDLHGVHFDNVDLIAYNQTTAYVVVVARKMSSVEIERLVLYAEKVFPHVFPILKDKKVMPILGFLESEISDETATKGLSYLYLRKIMMLQAAPDGRGSKGLLYRPK
ncbi:MAG: hypothetical protein OXC40_05900 [Proteobacteria bacterium]|nr:hypothetical protein [Pseudomonadota bacterium]